VSRNRLRSAAALGGLTTLRRLSLAHNAVGSECLTALTGLTLEYLSLSNCQAIRDASLASITCLRALTVLDVSWTHVTSAGLKCFSLLTALRSLGLSGARGVCDISPLAGLALTALHLDNTLVSDASLAHVPPTLVRLDLGDCGVTDLAPLTRCQLLAQLSLCACEGVHDKGLAALTALTALSALDLTYCGAVTDAGAACLAQTPALQRLGLAETGITDVGAACFAACTRLLEVDVHGCVGVTAAGRALLPPCPPALQYVPLSSPCEEV